MNRFERAVMVEATRLRELFAQRDASYLYFQIEVTGPIDHGELAVKFSIGGDRYSDNVSANTVDAAVDEHFRRVGWKREHDALLIPYLDSHKEE
jgi:hypothetical protein